MTTIAANLHCMAADSCVDAGGVVLSQLKIVRIRSRLVGTAGDVEAGEKYLDYLRKGGKQPKLKNVSFEALILDDLGLFYVYTDLRPLKLRNPFHAIGTGGGPALGALYAGKNPAQAVEIACKADVNSRPPVDVMYLKRRRT